MKKNLVFLLMAFLTLNFTACSDDDDSVYPVDEELAGTYKGTLEIELDGNTIASNLPKNVTIAKAGNNAISLELKNFSFMGLNLGTIKIENCALKQVGETYAFTGNQELTLAQPIDKCGVVVEGTIGNGKTKIDLDIDVTALGQKVEVEFNGTKLKGDENSEAKIISFVFENAPFVTEQPIINEDNKTISFKVLESATNEDLATLTPTIEISPKAVITPTSGVTQNFTQNVTYTVIAEDGTEANYTVSIAGRQIAMKLSFDEWESVGSGNSKHDEPVEEFLATSASAASLLWLFGFTDFPLYKEEEDVVAGGAAKLYTMNTSSKTSSWVPAITSGSIFTGTFKLDLKDRLNSTKFGILYDQKPVHFRGWYKYTPGTTFIDGSTATKPEEVEERPELTDECSIMAVLYEAKDADGNEVILTGHDINTSEYRVAVAALANGGAQSEYTYFDIPFTYLEGKTYEEGKEYKIAVICSSSKEGDLFKGAGGSTLWIDELEIIGE